MFQVFYFVSEASHLGAMLCRVGFIFPCNQPWDLCELNLDKEDSTIWRFQVNISIDNIISFRVLLVQYDAK